MANDESGAGEMADEAVGAERESDAATTPGAYAPHIRSSKKVTIARNAGAGIIVIFSFRGNWNEIPRMIRFSTLV